MEKLVSVIVPIYNMEQTLAHSVQSIIDQSYTNLEIILINDGSQDASASLCDKLAKKDDRIKVIHKKNEGVSIARNTGIETSSGDYLMFVDPDDWMDLDIVKRLLDVSVESSCDISICCATVVHEEISYKNSFFKIDKGEIEKERAVAQLFSDIHYNEAGKWMDVGVPWGKLYKAAYLKKNKIKFKPALRRKQDNIFNLYAFQYAEKIVYIDQPLYHYNIEHFRTGARKFVPDAVELYSNLAHEVLEFYKKYYSHDSLFKELVRVQLANLLIIVMTNNLAHPKNEKSHEQRINAMQTMVEETPFKIVFKNNNFDKYPKKLRLILSLLKNRRYNLTYLVYKVGFKLNM